MRPERITDVVAHHAESPVWWPRLGVLRFVDLYAGAILTLESDGSVSEVSVGSRVAACLRPRDRGGALVATERGLAIAARDDLSDLTPWGQLFADARQRFNDGACDPHGRFYAGTTSYAGLDDIALLYRIDSGEAGAVPVVSNLTTSNGMAFSPDGQTAYLNDTAAMRTYEFDYSWASGLTNQRIFLSFQPEEGRPDGLTVDTEDGVWIALNGGGCVRRYSTDGDLTDEIRFPVSQITACTFGGPGHRTLFCTSSSLGLADEPAAGSVFAVDAGVRGWPLNTFIGEPPRMFT